MIEDYIALLMLEHSEYESASYESVQAALKRYYGINTTVKELSTCYQPLFQFEDSVIEEEEDFYETY